MLFVSSGNSSFGISPIIKNQGDSLEKIGVEVIYYLIIGKGFGGYVKNVLPLCRYLRIHHFDIVHSHLSWVAYVSALAGAKPHVVSLMGWNVRKFINRFLIKFFFSFFWDVCIVKSKKMKDALGIPEIIVIPNGVDVDNFKPMSKTESQKEIGWDLSKKHVLFAANPSRPIKNYSLAKEAFDLLLDDSIVLHTLNNVNNASMPSYYNASDVVLLTSIAEGSPNVIKEALACNRIVVTTDVGDVSDLFSSVGDVYICSHNPQSIAKNLKIALNSKESRTGRMAIRELTSEIIAKKLINVYINLK